ncbi:hypothetical protein TRVA0_024S01882 [Trichomonascus vanleenenianus]|uniref:uncharacterized protein n=1 Tax=Trichomonascus vanleenenianus TaxID=2268995 RepID=UPI003EC9BE49
MKAEESGSVDYAGIRRECWYLVAVKTYMYWSGETLGASQRVVESTLVPLYVHFATTTMTLIPDSNARAFMLSMESDRDKRKPDSTPVERYQLKRTREALLQQIMPLALLISSLTAFILPLYDGKFVLVIRWLMTVLSAAIGPRVCNGTIPVLGVYIFGLMVNRALTISTIALGGWASFYLGVVMTKALGMQ